MLEQFDKQEFTNNYVKWILANGDETLRIDYSLNESSVVFDLGGYHGQWSKTIADKYNPYIYVFEPIKSFYEICKNTLTEKNKVTIINAAAFDKNGSADFYLQNDATSMMIQESHTGIEVCELVDINEFIEKENIETIDLIKINIEGPEYQILNHLIDSGKIEIFKNIQVQFHEIADRKSEYLKLQEDLSKTHQLTYQFIGIWENWQLKD